jgi:hypothetical protein
MYLFEDAVQAYELPVWGPVWQGHDQSCPTSKVPLRSAADVPVGDVGTP